MVDIIEGLALSETNCCKLHLTCAEPFFKGNPITQEIGHEARCLCERV